MKKFLSLSYGVESTAMAILYGKGATCIFCDTGAEPKQIYERIAKVDKILKEIHGGDIELVKIKASVNVKGVKVDNLIDYIKGYKYFPSKMMRFCTKEFKILPIDDFLSSQGDCELCIGFNADETPSIQTLEATVLPEDTVLQYELFSDDVTKIVKKQKAKRVGNLMACKNVTYSYPVHAAGLTREDCEDVLKEHGLEMDFPSYMNRGGCWMCFFKGLPELKAIYFFDRELFNAIKELELYIQDNNRKGFYNAFISLGCSIGDVEKQCEQELIMWGAEVFNMYKNVKSEQACGAFCHR